MKGLGRKETKLFKDFHGWWMSGWLGGWLGGCYFVYLSVCLASVCL